MRNADNQPNLYFLRSELTLNSKMPSPIGHSLIGLTVANLPLHKQLYHSVFWLGFVVFVANVPDLDFLPGLMIGDMNRYHHGISHSIGAAVIFAGLCALAAKYMSLAVKRVFIVAVLVYLSHLLGDYLGVDPTEPYGAPFLWPVSSEYYLSPTPIFQPIEHGDPGDGNASVFAEIFSHPNMLAAAIEIAIIAPFWLFTFWLSRRRN